MVSQGKSKALQFHLLLFTLATNTKSTTKYKLEMILKLSIVPTCQSHSILRLEHNKTNLNCPLDVLEYAIWYPLLLIGTESCRESHGNLVYILIYAWNFFGREEKMEFNTRSQGSLHWQETHLHIVHLSFSLPTFPMICKFFHL